ncbi:MAG: methyltransferase domain-containing protein [Candidatus Stahlbacteria bacterium]|nr:MAG: methyltransferase domain-containing protein [Candidatus Stahlbacteria bacterium]
MPIWLLVIVIVFGSILGFVFLWLTVAKIIRKLWRFPAPSYTGWFLDSGFRRTFQPPEKVIARSDINPGMKVLEIGCGSGAYTTFVARAVGGKGRVYALDIQPKMLRQLAAKLSKPENQDITNIKLIQASAYELPFEDSTLDLVCMVSVLYEIPDRHRALLEAHRVLKPSGILAVTEFFPDPDYPLRSTLVKQVTGAGFVDAKVLGNFWNYTARFIKPKESICL